MSEELKPCPFCGGTAIHATEGSTFRWVKMVCRECEASSGEVSTRTATANVDAWNTRTPSWQPIETAPKDGECLLWVETDNGGEVMKLERDSEGRWIYEGEPTYCASFYLNPTHWMPLPKPPKEEL